MFQIKVCGITSVEDALVAIEAGADAIGLNFYPPSPRSVDLSAAAGIVARINGRAKCVGVFVNEAVDGILAAVKTVGLDAIQLHGDEERAVGEELVARQAPPLIRAVRLSSGAKFEQMELWQKTASAFLIDAFVENEFGGTGKTANWVLAREFCARLSTPVILAGGLTSENVAAAIEQVSPAGVDTASGVESSPGKKDKDLVVQFVKESRRALSS